MNIPIIGKSIPILGKKKVEIRVRRQFAATLSLTLLNLRWYTWAHLQAINALVNDAKIPEFKKQLAEEQKLELVFGQSILEALDWELNHRGILVAKDKDEAVALAKQYDQKQFKMHV